MTGYKEVEQGVGYTVTGYKEVELVSYYPSLYREGETIIGASRMRNKYGSIKSLIFPILR